MTRAVWTFVLISYGFSWTLAELYYRLAEPSPLGFMVLAMVFMWGPALGAIVATRWVLGQPLSWLGPYVRWSPWLILAWTAPLLYAALHLGVAVLAPGVSVELDADALRNSILAAVPAEQQALAQAQLAALGEGLVWILAAQIVFGGLIAGASINALAAFGEELGWRGFMQRWAQTVGFWRGNAAIGVIWGLWHAPMILRGHNYPEHPTLGLGFMVLFCLGMAPLFAAIRERAGSLLAPCLMHGTLNGTGGIAVFLVGASDLWRGPAGGAGLIVLAAANLVLWWRRR